MRRDDVPRPGLPTALALAVLLVAGCSDGPAPVAPQVTPSPTVTSADPTFEQVLEALTPDLVPSADVLPCEELEPGSSQARAELDRLAAERLRDTATQEEGAAPTPTLPTCGVEGVEDLRAASILGSAYGPEDEIVLPVVGGALRSVDVYELADREAAATTYARFVSDPAGFAHDQEIPEQALEGGLYQPRRVVTGSAGTAVDVPGWTATVLSRDETSFARDGSPATEPVSYAELWAVRDVLLVRVQVAGDEPGAAAASATATLEDLVAAVTDVTR